MAIKQWLSDKKNLPIVIALAALLLIGAGVAAAFETGLLGGQAQQQPTQATGAIPNQTTPLGLPPGASRPGMPSQQLKRPMPSPFGAPVAIRPNSIPGHGISAAGSRANTTPGAINAAIAGANLTPAQKTALLRGFAQQQAAIADMSPQQKLAAGQKLIALLKAKGYKLPTIAGLPGTATARASRNPFSPGVDLKKINMPAVPPPVFSYVPIVPIFRLPNLGSHNPNTGIINTGGPNGAAAIAVPLGRVAGVINSNGIRAIYELNGQDTIITPGSLLPENGGRVQSIQSDGITVQLPDSNQTVQIPVSAGNSNANSQQNTGVPQIPGASQDQADNGDLNND